MPEDRVTITADARQYFDVLSRAGVAADRLGASGARVGEGFVRGERVIRTASANIASALTMSGDAATTVLIAAQGLERVFKIGIGPTIAVAAGVKAFEVMHEAVKKTNDAYKDLREELAKPLITDAVTAEADAKITELTKKIEALRKQAESPVSKTSGIFAALAGLAGSAFLPQFLRGPTISALSGLTPVGPGKISTATDEAAKRLDAFAAQKGEAILRAADKLRDALVEAIQRFRTSTGNLFRDIGSGQFFKDQQQRQQENLQTQAGQEMIRQFEQDLANGVILGPNATAAVNAARAAAAKGGVGINDILNADFSNLDLLSKYDFSGLAPLSGITIIVK